MRISILILAFVLCSCALTGGGRGHYTGFGKEKFRVVIDSVADKNYKNFKTFRVIPAQGIEGASVIEFKRYSRYVVNLFKKQGLREVSDGAELTIRLAYSVMNKSFTEKVHHAGGMTGNGVMTGGWTSNVHRKVYENFVELRGTRYDGLEIFNTTIKSKRKKQNIKKAFPYLVEAASRYIGTELSKEVKVSIDESEKNLLNVL